MVRFNMQYVCNYSAQPPSINFAWLKKRKNQTYIYIKYIIKKALDKKQKTEQKREREREIAKHTHKKMIKKTNKTELSMYLKKRGGYSSLYQSKSKAENENQVKVTKEKKRKKEKEKRKKPGKQKLQ